MDHVALEFVSVDPPRIFIQTLKEPRSGRRQRWKLGQAFLVFSKDLAVVFLLGDGIARYALLTTSRS
jgi:hypothetical protein